CAGVVHGDLSDFNVLLSAHGPVLIDFPQAVDASGNPHAKRLLIRDVDNVVGFLSRWLPHLRGKAFGQQMWDLWTRNALDPETELDGRFRPRRAPDRKEKSRSLMEELDALAQKSKDRAEKLGVAARPARTPKFVVEEAPPPPSPPPADASTGGDKKKRKRRRKKKPASEVTTTSGPASVSAAEEPMDDDSVFDDLDALLSSD
ncbi:MAG: hypothetical protein KC621_16100, partial [Myxococcales bacterium]|nr:hypothetical protein [Myxococcales bacterium]